MNISNFILGLIIILLSIIGWIYWAAPWSEGFGPMSLTCIELREKGYFETHWEYVGHDSCIEGEYEWRDNCSFIVPWWEHTRCLYSYDHDDYNDTCGEKRAEEYPKDYSRFNFRCVTSPFAKIVWIIPNFICVMVFIVGLAILISSMRRRGI